MVSIARALLQLGECRAGGEKGVEVGVDGVGGGKASGHVEGAAVRFGGGEDGERFRYWYWRKVAARMGYEEERSISALK